MKNKKLLLNIAATALVSATINPSFAAFSGEPIIVTSNPSGSCGSGCTYEYDSSTRTLSITGNSTAELGGDISTIVISDGATSFGGHIAFNEGIDIIVPDTLQSIGFNNHGGALGSIYCKETSQGRCNSLSSNTSNLKTYTVDENGVYDSGDTLYTSFDNLRTGSTASCGQMANCLATIGTSCDSPELCQTLMDMAQAGTNCSSISTCKTYLDEHPAPAIIREEQPDGSVKITDAEGNVRYEGKRIYTIEEANAVAGDKNRVSIRYR
ncbi:MAG: hypothetical protein IJ830_02055 [Alphaproteobacteria bacterium]|nr:hypothetical protein [Alphaproteobacteria bacterium]